jgi:rod shape-determining protein MreC
VYFNSANSVSGAVLSSIQKVSSYFRLQSINQILAKENALLRQQLTSYQNLQSQNIPTHHELLRSYAFKFRPARVINNSTNRFNNYITIDRGTADSVRPGMGVISPLGVVGKVNACSKNFSTIISLLHGKWAVSAQIHKSNIDGIVKWDGKHPRLAEMLYVGRHHKLKVNDTVVTSGYNAIYPKGIPIGKVRSISLDQGKPFYKIKVLLSTDFSKLSYVYVIENTLALEKDSLESDTLLFSNRKF